MGFAADSEAANHEGNLVCVLLHMYNKKNKAAAGSREIFVPQRNYFDMAHEEKAEALKGHRSTDKLFIVLKS